MNTNEIIMTAVWFMAGLLGMFLDGWIKSQDKTMAGYWSTLKSDQRVIAKAIFTYAGSCVTLYAIDGALGWSNILMGIVCKDYLTTAQKQSDDKKGLKS